MDTHGKVLRLGAAAIACALLFRLCSLGMPQMLLPRLLQPNMTAFLIYLETGRDVRFLTSAQVFSPEYAGESAAPAMTEEPREKPVFSAEDAQKGMSLLADKEGEKIGADIVTIIDDPRYKDSQVKRTFDGEGVATYAKNVVENGTLTTLLHNLKTAANAGVKSTGNASKASYASVVGVSPFTFYIQPMDGTKEDLFEMQYLQSF